MNSYSDILAGFQQIPLTKSKIIMVHSSYKSLGGVEGGAGTVINALLEWVGPDGTVLFPTFNFTSWSEDHYFDINETPSHMGIIGELARQQASAIRTRHPMYSFAVLGKNRNEFAACDDVEAYGRNSVFQRFHELNGTIVSIGLGWNSTFSLHHYVEYRTGCNYRRTKRFAGIYVESDGIRKITTYTMFVRKDQTVTTDIVPGMDELFENGVIRATQIGSAIVHYASANDFFDSMSVIVRQHPEKLHRVQIRSF